MQAATVSSWSSQPLLRVFARPAFRRVLGPGAVAILAAVYVWRFVLPLVIDPRASRADDFQDYLFAARQIAVGGDPYADFDRTHVPWDWSLSSGYLYPPAFAALLLPLTRIPNDLAVRLWLLVLQAMVLASFVLIYRTIGRPRRGELLCMMAIVTTFFPLAANLYTGAMNPLMLFMVTTAWISWRSRRELACGTVLGAASVVKVIPLGLVPYLVARRHWRVLATFALIGLIGLAAGFVVTSAPHNLHYFRDILPHLGAGTGYRENSSITGVAIRLCDPVRADQGGAGGWCGHAIAWPAIGVLLALLLAVTRRDSRGDLEFALAVTLLPLVSSVTWSFHLVLLLFPIALLVRRLFEARQVSGAGLLALLVAWACFAVAPGLHFALVLHPLPSWPGLLDLFPRAVTRALAEAQLAGTLLIFGVLWTMVRQGRLPAPSQPRR